MNLREEILEEHSKLRCQKITEWVGKSQPRFDELFAIFMEEESILTQRASWPLSNCVELHPSLIENKFDQLIKKLHTTPLHDAIKRNSMRLLQFTTIPEKFEGEIMDICFKFLESPKETLSVKVFSLYILAKLAKKYPDISSEIKLLIDEQLPHQSAGFKIAVRKVLKVLGK